MHSLEPEAFPAFVDEKRRARKEKFLLKQHYTIDCLPEVAAAFEQTEHVSSKLPAINPVQHGKADRTSYFGREESERSKRSRKPNARQPSASIKKSLVT